MNLDTSFLIDLMQEDNAAKHKLAELDVYRVPLYLSAQVVMELAQGVALSKKRDTEERRVQAALRLVLIHDMTKAIAYRAGILHGELEQAGNGIEPEDCVIAATALEHQDTLLTRNTKHFARVKGLKLETY